MFMIDINFPYPILHFDRDNLKNLCMETTLDTTQVVVLTKQSRILKLKIYNYQQPLENKVMFGNSFCFLFSKTCFWEYK